MNKQEIWDKCVAFHGHTCGGLTIGFRAALYAAELLNLSFSEDENVVCVSENDACGVDAIQVILGCSVGKGNLLFHMRGKQAYSFYERASGKSVRLILKQPTGDLSKEERLNYLMEKEASELFSVMETRVSLPTNAQIFKSHICEICGESTGENWIRLQNDKKVCLDCFSEYDRFKV